MGRPEIGSLGRLIIAAEDRRFFWHLGIDPIAIIRAAWVNLRAGRCKEGGSTITQQLARTLFGLGTEKTLRRKLVEAGLAVWLELKYSKIEILDLYYKSIFMGNRNGKALVGIQASAQYHFGANAKALPEILQATLVASICAPNRLRPGTRDNMTRALVLLNRIRK